MYEEKLLSQKIQDLIDFVKSVPTRKMIDNDNMGSQKEITQYSSVSFEEIKGLMQEFMQFNEVDTKKSGLLAELDENHMLVVNNWNSIVDRDDENPLKCINTILLPSKLLSITKRN